MFSREMRILRDALKHEQAVARGRIMNIKKDFYNLSFSEKTGRDMFSRSAYVDVRNDVLSLKKFDAIKDESLRKVEMESALKTLKKRNEAPRGKASYIKEVTGVRAQRNAKSFFDGLHSGGAKDLMHEALNYGDSDDTMDFIIEHKDVSTDVTEADVLKKYGKDIFEGI